MEKEQHRQRVALNQLIDRYQKHLPNEEAEDYTELQKRLPLLEKIFVLADCGVVIFDASKAGYLYISDSTEYILGHSRESIQAGGLGFIGSITHPDDTEGMIKILQKELDFLSSIPPVKRLEHQSSYDYRVQRSDGSYVRLLQRNLILDLDKKGNMLHMLIVVSDITHLKKDGSIILNINNEKETCFSYIYNTTAHTISKENFLSIREMEVLRLLERGLSSKQISNELYISVHTVETHRRNMLEKTNVRDTSSLVSFALAAGVL